MLPALPEPRLPRGGLLALVLGVLREPLQVPPGAIAEYLCLPSNKHHRLERFGSRLAHRLLEECSASRFGFCNGSPLGAAALRTQRQGPGTLNHRDGPQVYLCGRRCWRVRAAARALGDGVGGHHAPAAWNSAMRCVVFMLMPPVRSI